jgi:hypothetical protein
MQWVLYLVSQKLRYIFRLISIYLAPLVLLSLRLDEVLCGREA